MFKGLKMYSYNYIQTRFASFAAHRKAANDPDYKTLSTYEIEDKNLDLTYMTICFTDHSEWVHFELKYGRDLPG